MKRTIQKTEVEVDDLVQLHPGQIYIDSTNNKRVVLKWVNVRYETKEIFAIVHPEGEPDMQSCYGIRPHLLRLTE